jgi:CheY-like chemotaxis protein
VLYITGYTDDTVLLHGVAAEEVELLRKPFSPALLVNAIKRAIAKSCGKRGSRPGGPA